MAPNSSRLFSSEAACCRSTAMSRSVDHLVRKNYLTREEFLSYFKKVAG